MSEPLKRVSARKNAARKRAKHQANQARRAALCQEFQGDRSWQTAGKWHETLKGLSAGTAT